MPKLNLMANYASQDLANLEKTLKLALEEIQAAKGTDTDEQKTMREAVAKQYGQTVADSLNGEALKELYEQINKGTGTPAANSQHKQLGVPAPKDYFS
ncbi:hypothetical protein [Vibrio parahaemolyticus]|uniref:hypothetical protein n=1 Tax=Vibrio parahaemolyticus TaxID=670 RepID=UPI0038926404